MHSSSSLKHLRHKAEKALAENQDACSASFHDIENYLDELQIYHIELEMQAEELRRTQEELLASRDRYLELYHQAPVGYISLTFAGMILRANSTFASMLDTFSNNLANQPLSRFIAASDRSLFHAVCGKAKTSSATRSCELLFTSENASFYAQLNFIVVEEDQAFGPHYRVSVVDISERIAAEKERLRLEREVLNTQKEESLRRLAGGIAHNFNNLLTGVIGNIDLVRGSIPQHDETEEMLTDAYRSSLKLADLSIMMLHYLGQSAGEQKTLELVAAVKQLLDLFRRTVQGHMHIVFTPQAEKVFIEADPLQFAQIINNLLANAVEAIHPAPGLITITVEICEVQPDSAPASLRGERVAPGKYSRIEIADNGCGMDKETLKKSIDPFFTTKSTGRGLGLSAAWGITRSCSGFLVMDSTQGQGTTVQLYFPHKQAKFPAPPPLLEKSEVPLLEVEGTRILCVDDDNVVREIIKRFTENLGWEIVEAADGREAVKRFRDDVGSFSCVLLDFSLPDFDGHMVLNELRALQPDLPVLLVSGHHPDYLRGKFTHEHPDQYVQKPFQRDELLDAIRRVMNTRPPAE